MGGLDVALYQIYWNILEPPSPLKIGPIYGIFVRMLTITTTTTNHQTTKHKITTAAGSRKSEGKKRKGEADYEEVGNDGKPCRTQKFRMNPPAEEFMLATDSGGSEDEWCKGVDDLMHQDHLNDIAWWCEVEAAIEADDRKRHIEEGSARADSSKRPKKPG